MSGYSSKAEVIEVVKGTIRMGSSETPDLSRNPGDYFISRIVSDTFASRGTGYGWGASTGSEGFYDALRRHRRKR